MSRLVTSALIGLAMMAGVVATLDLAALASPPLEARTSDASGVKVVVTPRPVRAGADVWEFNVVLDTHSRALSEDIAQASVIVDDAGRRFPALAWVGDAPGGHHREGVLRFTAPAPPVQFIELKMEAVGGAEARTFRWNLK